MKMAIQLITEECRIAAICIVFEALTAKRQYKEPMTSNEALNLMTNFNQLADGGKIRYVKYNHMEREKRKK